MPTGIYKRTEKHCLAISKGLKSMPKSKRRALNKKISQSLSKQNKKERVTYEGIHIRIKTRFGTPKKCEKCGTKKAKLYQWHNISGNYFSERWDWQRLCNYCHKGVHCLIPLTKPILYQRHIIEGKFVNQIAREFNVDHGTVVRHLIRHNIPVNLRKDRRRESVNE